MAPATINILGANFIKKRQFHVKVTRTQVNIKGKFVGKILPKKKT